MRRLPLDFRDQYFGCEIELTGINRATAAQTLADLFGTRAEHSGGGYDTYCVKDLDGKEWKIVRDGSIHPECRRRSVLIGETYKVELNSPKLEYGEMEKLQEVVRSLRRAGGIVNDSCGMHVHVDASKHTPQSLKNVLSIMYSKEDILFAALKVNPARIDSYCQAVDEPILEEIRKLPSGASMDQLKDRWYRGRDGSDYHYHQSRYQFYRSYDQMGHVYEQLEGRLPYPMFKAARGGQRFVEQFKQCPNAVLLAGGPCWEGVDFPGDVVSLLVIVRLPFPVPDPVREARREHYPDLHSYIQAEIVPEMQQKLRQGFGRAIRTEQDSCVVAILDERAGIGGKYHDAALAALPTCPTTEKIEDVQQFIREQKHTDYFL